MYVDPLNSKSLPPILTDFPIPTPPVKTTDPVLAAVVLLVELKVAVPVLAPNEIVVAAPKAFIVVAFVLNTAKEESEVTTLVENVGVVPNTNAPEPVSSLIMLANDALVVITDAVPELI